MLVGSMTRPGRPSHPEILTPREQEVLALLREGLTNPRIAERLSITLDGAKYHVSEILSKLGVSSREEAARWQASERPWWSTAIAPLAWPWRRANVSWLATGVAGVMAVLLVVGVGLLVWGLVRTDGDADAGAQEGPIEVRGIDELRSTSRSEFVVCVDGAGGNVLSASDVDQVKLELEAALATVSDLPAALRNPTVTDDCPPAPAGILDGMSQIELVMDTGTNVETPSDELLWVYLLPQAGYEAAFGTERSYMVGTAEWICGGRDVCFTVTTAVYVNEAIDADLFRKVLLVGLIGGRVEPSSGQIELDDLDACDRGQIPTYFRCEDLAAVREVVEQQLDDN